MTQFQPHQSGLPSFFNWTGPGRAVVFVLAATSIWCLLAEMYNVIDMRPFTLFILLPATVLLYAMAVANWMKCDRLLAKFVLMGTVGGLIGSVAYDLFRVPFVFSHVWGLERFGVPQMPLFMVFPRFGAMILGLPLQGGVAQWQPGFAWGAGYTPLEHVVGWAYHFSNGATFGVMFAAVYGSVREALRGGAATRIKPIVWGMALAVTLEICLLLSPYATFFGIHPDTRFVVVTLIAHVIFGIALGVYYGWQSREWRLVKPAIA